MEQPLAGGSAPRLVVRTQGTDRSLQAGPAYVIGRGPECDIVIADARVSWRHAVLRVEVGFWVLADIGSTNGIYSNGQRIDRFQISAECQFRIGHPVQGLVLTCIPESDNQAGELATAQRAAAERAAAERAAAERAAAEHIATAPAQPRPWPAPLGPDGGPAVPGVRTNTVVVALGAGVHPDSAPTLLPSPAHAPAPPPAHSPVPVPVAVPMPVPAAVPALAPLAAPSPIPAPAAAPSPLAAPAAARAPAAALKLVAAAPAAGAGPIEIPYAVRWLVRKGERFANFDILNDNDIQLDYYRWFGHIYAVGIPAKKWRLVVVSDPDLLDEVAANEAQFGKRVEEINFFDQLSRSRGGGISVLGDGEHYDKIRRVMLPWYAPSHQRTQLERMKEQARNLVAAWSAMPDSDPLDARAWMERYTLEVAGRGACSYNFGLLDGSGNPHPFAAAVPESTKESIARVAEPRPDFTLFAGRARRARRQRYLRHNTELFRTADALVRARLHTCPLGQQTDLLTRLVSTPDPETGQLLDTETVRDQVLTHLSNGFNEPSITAGWLVYLLAAHPDVEERLIAEIDGITGGDPGYDLRYDDLSALTYTTQVINEALRVYPPMPITIRRSLKEGTLGRYRVRKDDIILVGALAAQRDPRYWGPDPDRFDPEQFAIEKVADRPRHAFIPFSIGRRQCMAQEVTFMMLRVVLFEIYRHYRLRLAPGAKVAKNTIVTTKPVAVPVVRLPRRRAEPGPAPASGAPDAISRAPMAALHAPAVPRRTPTAVVGRLVARSAPAAPTVPPAYPVVPGPAAGPWTADSDRDGPPTEAAPRYRPDLRS